MKKHLDNDDLRILLYEGGELPNNITNLLFAVMMPDGQWLEIDDEHPLVVSWTQQP